MYIVLLFLPCVSCSHANMYEVSTKNMCICIYDGIEPTLSCIDIMFGSEIVQSDVHTHPSLSLLLCRFVSCVFPVLLTFLLPHFWASPLLWETGTSRGCPRMPFPLRMESLSPQVTGKRGPISTFLWVLPVVPLMCLYMFFNVPSSFAVLHDCVCIEGAMYFCKWISKFLYLQVATDGGPSRPSYQMDQEHGKT